MSYCRFSLDPHGTDPGTTGSDCPQTLAAWNNSSIWDESKIATAQFGDKLGVRVVYGYDFLLLPEIPIWGVTTTLPGVVDLNGVTVMNYE